VWLRRKHVLFLSVFEREKWGMEGVFLWEMLISMKGMTFKWMTLWSNVSLSPLPLFHLLCFYSFPSLTPHQHPAASPQLSLSISLSRSISAESFPLLFFSFTQFKSTLQWDHIRALNWKDIFNVLRGKNHLENGNATVKMSS